MKRFLRVPLFLVFVFLAVFLTIKCYYNYADARGITIKNDELGYNIKYKGLNGAKDFTVDNKGNYYIAYKDKIQVIESKGKSYDILKDQNLNIFSIEFSGNKLYFSSDTKIHCYDLNSKEQYVVFKDMPNFGDYRNSIIKIRGDYLYITIGAATNSGVVGEDNKWVKDNFYVHDITPKDITLKGLNFGTEKTGAFQSYRTKSIKGQIVPGHFPGNASVAIYNLKTGNSETLAWGIRNVTGMDFNSESKLISAVGGMEDRGSRPIKGDTDYIYEVKKGEWYGWPDYSGGDQINSPKFKSNKPGALQFLLENHPTTNPLAPVYQHKTVGSIGGLAVDSNGLIGEKNYIYFYDKLDNIIYGFSGAGAIKQEAKFSGDNSITSIKFGEKALLMLDSKDGNLFSLERENIGNKLKIDKNLYLYLLATTLFGIFLLLKFLKE